MESHQFGSRDPFQHPQHTQPQPTLSSTTVNRAGFEQHHDNPPALLGNQSSTGADHHLQAIRDSFKLAANSLTEFYKQSSHSYNVAYQQGRTDSYDEIFAWLLAQTQMDPQIKNVSIQRFKQHMQDKLNDDLLVGKGEFQAPTQHVAKHTAQGNSTTVESSN